MSPTSYSREQAQSGPCRRAAQQARNSNHHLITLQKDKKTKRQEDKKTKIQRAAQQARNSNHHRCCHHRQPHPCDMSRKAYAHIYIHLH